MDQPLVSISPQHIAVWISGAWSWTDVIGEQWHAPDQLTAERWVDEITARGGHAYTQATYSSIGTHYTVHVTHTPYGTSSKLR